MYIEKVKDVEELQSIEVLASHIWKEHYTPIIGADQVHYMLDKFQSMKAMQAQIKDDYVYASITEIDELVGYLAYQVRDDILFLSKFYIERRMRGKGLGAQAMLWLVDQARSIGAKAIELTVNKYNENSIRIYQKMGFSNIKPVVFDIGEGYIMDDYLLRMEL